MKSHVALLCFSLLFYSFVLLCFALDLACGQCCEVMSNQSKSCLKGYLFSLQISFTDFKPKPAMSRIWLPARFIFLLHSVPCLVSVVNHFHKNYSIYSLKDGKKLQQESGSKQIKTNLIQLIRGKINRKRSVGARKWKEIDFPFYSSEK